MKIAKKILLSLIVFAAVAYAGDDLIARLRGRPGAEVKVNRFLVIPQKFNKIEYDPQDPVMVHCVSALFPHFGSQPCWYLRRHAVQLVDIG